jgi:hypothetical protein
VQIFCLGVIDRKGQREEEGPVKRKGNIFLEPWEGLVISRVEIRGNVIGVTRFGEGGHQIVVDDGSGRISCIAWDSYGGQTLGLPPVSTFYNKFVAIRGQLTGFRAELQIRVDDLLVIADQEEPTEECIWWLDCKKQWEELAAAARFTTVNRSKGDSAHFCPCLCHSAASATSCQTLGSYSSWPSPFTRAVSVLCSTLRAMVRARTMPIRIPLPDLVKLVKEHVGESYSIGRHSCYPDCATVEAVRELTREGFIEPDGAFLIVRSEPALSTITTEQGPAEELSTLNRYPMTPAETLLTQPNQPVIDLRMIRKKSTVIPPA